MTVVHLKRRKDLCRELTPLERAAFLFVRLCNVCLLELMCLVVLGFKEAALSLHFLRI